jgi:hypothetical protein
MLEQVTIAAKTSEDRFSECGFFLPGIGFGPHSDNAVSQDQSRASCNCELKAPVGLSSRLASLRLHD